ncbi:copper chaperone PCu(A)C [Spirillospora sp. NPDC048824]|uniref:copper chaperone PCu(A)C n=1 Tax=Spirillospora sp. NPDC048824 TaxID=3364526 RepID=UPI003723EFB2
MRRSTAALAALLLAAGSAACTSRDTDGDGPRLAVTGAYVRQPPMRDLAAGYLTVVNTGRDADELIAATADIAGEVQLHTTVDNAMKQVESMTVPPHGRLELRMGGDHLMLMKLKSKPEIGDTVTFTLRFAISSPITVQAPVRPTDHRPAPAPHGERS